MGIALHYGQFKVGISLDHGPAQEFWIPLGLSSTVTLAKVVDPANSGAPDPDRQKHAQAASVRKVRVTGRLLSPFGEPHPGGILQTWPEPTPVEPGGQFTLELEANKSPRSLSCQVGPLQVPWPYSIGPIKADSESVDLGDLKPIARAGLAQGIVLDSAGKLASHVRVQVHHADTDDDDQAPGTWTDEQGRFWLTEWERTGSKGLLSATRADGQSAMLVLQTAQSGLRLQMSAPITLEAKVHLDPHVPASNLVAILESSPGQLSQRRGERARYSKVAAGRIIFPNLEPGRYDIRLHAIGNESSVLYLAGIDLSSQADPLEIDLRGMLGAVAVRVRDSHGEKIPQGTISLDQMGGQFEPGASLDLTWNQGSFPLLASKTGIDLYATIRAPGYYSRACQFAPGDEPTLQSAPDFTLHVPPLSPGTTHAAMWVSFSGTTVSNSEGNRTCSHPGASSSRVDEPSRYLMKALGLFTTP